MTRADAYARFCATANLATWQECLDEYRALETLEAVPEPETLRELGEAICITAYTRWLANLRGEEERVAELRDRLARLTANTRYCEDHPDSQHARFALASAAAANSYAAVAARHVSREDAPIELAVLMLPDVPRKQAAVIRPKLEVKSAQAFLPAVYFFASALLELGYSEEALRAIEKAGAAFDDNALVIDVKAKIAELNGDWAAARELYRNSDWVAHQYRHAICDIIMSAEHGEPVAVSVPDEVMVKGMRLFSAEIDQAEIARRELFVNSCAWHDFDNWLVRFELGVLNFRRRRHSEAEGMLRAAARSTPAACALAVNHLRFINFTWMTGNTLREIPVEPEMLECGHLALEAAGSEDTKAQIRTFIASTTRDFRVLEPVFGTTLYDEIARAKMLVEDLPGALENYCRTIGDSYSARPLAWLARFFYRARFRCTADYLVGLVIEQSWDEFVVLWELAYTLLGLQAGDAALDERQAAHFKRLLGRLQELCTSEFQHTIRAIEFFLQANRDDIAAGLLRRADQMAESADEQLQLARARRAISRGEVDVLGISNLTRAERDATDRMVRLQVAHELAIYGQVQHARRILENEGVFDANTHLEHIEYIIVLQCGRPCLTEDEIKEIGDAAGKALGEALKTGAITHYGRSFVDRLGEYRADPLLVETTDEEPDPEGTGPSRWIELKSNLEKSRTDPDVGAERQLLFDNILQGDEISLFMKYALWDEVYRNFEQLVEVVNSIRPEVDDSETPLTRSKLLLSGTRARDRSALWKNYFRAESQTAATDAEEALRQFDRREQALLENWRKARGDAMSKPRERLAVHTESLRALLKSMRNDQRTANSWPTWLALGDHIDEDIQLLDDELSRYAAAGRQKAEVH